ncbi:holin family protein [bacterium]|nr:holin family protein [bacterium]
MLDIVKIGADLINKLIPDKSQADQAKLKLLELQQNGQLKLEEFAHNERLGQIDLNKAEAQSSNLFVSGARPSAMWVCSLGFAYSVIVQPIMQGLGYNFPILDNDVLMTMLGALLGLGSFRTFEKTRKK